MGNYLIKLFKKDVILLQHKMTLGGENSFISIENDCTLFMSPLKGYNKTPNDIKYEDVKPWLNEKCTIIENTMNVFTRLRNMFSCRPAFLLIYLNKIEPTPIPNILSHPCVENLTGIHFINGKLQRYELDAIMEWKGDRPIQYLSVIYNEIPSDYNHPNALRFPGAVYSDARWICLKDLLSIRNTNYLVLGQNNFESKDLNKFIKYWINCKQHMTDCLSIENHRINISELMKDVTVLKTFRSNKEFYLVASNSTVNQRLMTVQLINHTDRLGRKKQLDFAFQSASRPLKITYRGETLPTWAREYRILSRMARKRLLEEGRITVEGGEVSIAKELGEIETELAAERVQLIDGFMTVQENL
uniref:FBA_2 domain-containing protein n=1 Tax=Caenorhabditis tropicalis TaxID=1561998 RepID=A0A1I7TI18_9PELO